MESKIYLATDDEIKDIARALSSELRRKILKFLGYEEMNVGEIANALGIPQSTCVVNIQILEKAKLLKTKQVAATKGVQKICYIPYNEVVLPILPETHLEEKNFLVTEMPIGLYTDCKISSPCGLVSEKEIIGYFDQEDSFFNPKRASAGLIWFTKGFCEYRFPKAPELATNKIKNLSISFELCSEYPGFNNEWPSDITVWINNNEIGTWRSPGDFGSEYGKLTPKWWDLKNTQYGLMKTWKVTNEGSFVDGEKVGSFSLDALDYKGCDSFQIKIGIKEDAEFCGGINLFGSTFGNYKQDILLRIELER